MHEGKELGMDIKMGGRSIPDDVLDVVDEVWGGDVPVVREGVQRLRGVAVPDVEAMRHERAIAEAVRAHTLAGGGALGAEAARVLVKLMPCIEGSVYGAGVDWVDIAEAAGRMGRHEGHVRRMIINEKISVRMIRRPSSGKMAEKRWLSVEDVERA